MHTVNKLAAVATTALLLGTGLASALDLPSNVTQSINDAVVSSSATESINAAVVAAGATDSINDAVVAAGATNSINDAVLAGAKKGGTPSANGRDIVLAFTCEAGGNALLTLRNKGDAVPAGTKLRWDVKSLGERGAVRLKTALGSGETVRVDIGMDVDAGTPCAAKAI